VAGQIIVSSIKTDSDNSISFVANTGATIFSANLASGLSASSFGNNTITSDKIVSVANTKIDGNIVSSQITSVANTQLTGTVTSAQVGSSVYEGMSMRNRIINGDMRIDQRNAGASSTPSVNGTYLVDRWQLGFSAGLASKFTVGQNLNSVTPPVGFTNYFGIQVASTATPSSTDNSYFAQPIEANNMSDLAWGTANAKTVTLSFQVYSSLTGTFSGSLFGYSSGRSYPFTFSIASANTWTSISITVSGDTSGTWAISNSGFLYVLFNLGSGSSNLGTANAWSGTQYFGATGSVQLVSNSAATFYITGVQLEVGSVATPFERRPFGTELALCQRYFCKTFSTGTAPAQNTGYTGALGAIAINAGASTALWAHFQFPSEMRAVPTITTFSPTAANANWYSPAGPSSTTSAGSFGNSTRFANIYNTTAPAAGANIVYYVQATASSEL